MNLNDTNIDTDTNYLVSIYNFSSNEIISTTRFSNIKDAFFCFGNTIVRSESFKQLELVHFDKENNVLFTTKDNVSSSDVLSVMPLHEIPLFKGLLGKVSEHDLVKLYLESYADTNSYPSDRIVLIDGLNDKKNKVVKLLSECLKMIDDVAINTTKL